MAAGEDGHEHGADKEADEHLQKRRVGGLASLPCGGKSRQGASGAEMFGREKRGGERIAVSHITAAQREGQASAQTATFTARAFCFPARSGASRSALAMHLSAQCAYHAAVH